MTVLGNIIINLNMSLSSQKNTGRRHVLSWAHPRNSSLVSLDRSQGSANTCDSLYQHLLQLLLDSAENEQKAKKNVFLKGRGRCKSRKSIFTSFYIFTPRTWHVLSFTLGKNHSYFIIPQELSMIYAGMAKEEN